jgi:hypothetical protein
MSAKELKLVAVREDITVHGPEHELLSHFQTDILLPCCNGLRHWTYSRIYWHAI